MLYHHSSQEPIVGAGPGFSAGGGGQTLRLYTIYVFKIML